MDVLVAAAADGGDPSDRDVRAIGEAKAGETVGVGHLRRLEKARASLGTRAAHAKLLLFAPAFHPDLVTTAQARGDLELIDLDRLYEGS